jgi:hypothetical protein
MSYKYTLSVCVCIRNEAKYMAEFIQHYIKQGVDHFYIITNNSTDNIEDVISQSPYKDAITLITDNREFHILTKSDGTNGHITLFNENLYSRMKEETEWAIIIDIDEFMYGKNGNTIQSFLRTVDPSIGCIYVLWNIINPVKEGSVISTEFSIQNNVNRINYDKLHELSWYIKNANDFGKSIIRTSMLMDHTKLHLHKIKVSGITMNNYGPNINGYYDNCNEIQFSETLFQSLPITLNHYAIRNAEDYIKKEKQINVLPHKNAFIHGLFEMIHLDDSYLITDSEISA